jgi:hypothetical protein
METRPWVIYQLCCISPYTHPPVLHHTVKKGKIFSFLSENALTYDG